MLAAVLADSGVPAAWIDARHVMRTNSRHGSAVPDLARTRDAVTRLVAPQLSRGVVAVLGGFIGSDPSSVTTTLGRGGSDYSAAVFGACLEAEEIQIWTDVDGVLTADPRVIPHARPVARLSYGEAHDLASFGAKVLHPGTIQPAVDRSIPVIVRNSYRPAAAGTVVGLRDASAPLVPVAGLACRTGATLLEVNAHDDAAGEGFVSSVFAALQQLGVDAVLADQCGRRLVLTVQDLVDVESVRLSISKIADVRVATGLATVSVVGDGLTGDPHLADEAARALAELPVHLVSRPPGGRTLGVCCRRETALDGSSASSRLLFRRREPADAAGAACGAGMTVNGVRRPARVAIAGFGTVGRSVARLLQELAPPELQLAVIVNRSVDRKRVDWVDASVRWTESIDDALGDDVDVFVELIGGRSPAEDWIRRALRAGKSS